MRRRRAIDVFVEQAGGYCLGMDDGDRRIRTATDLLDVFAGKIDSPEGRQKG